MLGATAIVAVERVVCSAPGRSGNRQAALAKKGSLTVSSGIGLVQEG